MHIVSEVLKNTAQNSPKHAILSENGRPFVKRFALCCLTLVLSVLSVTLVYCGQTVERIKMKLGMVVGLAPAKLC